MIRSGSLRRQPTGSTSITRPPGRPGGPLWWIPPRLRWALTAFIVSKLTLIALGYLVIAVFDGFSAHLGAEVQTRAAGGPVSRLWFYDPVNMWFRWDAFHYQWLTELSYTQPVSDYERHLMSLFPNGHESVEPPASRFTFLPLLPLLSKIFLPLTGGNARVAVLIVVNLALLGLLWVIAALAEELFDHKTARLAVIFTAAAPTAFLLHIAMTESLFLFLNLLALYLAYRKKWWLAAIPAFLVGLTRSSGFLLAIPLALLLLDQVRWRFGARSLLRYAGALVPVIAPGLGWASFLAYCYRMTGDALVYAHLQKVGWNITTQMPWVPLLEAFGAGGLSLVTIKAAIVVGLGVLLVLTFRYVPYYLVLYCGALLALPMMIGENWAASIIRYTSGLFAITLLLAAMTRRFRGLEAPLIGVMAAFQGVLFATWTLEWTRFII